MTDYATINVVKDHTIPVGEPGVTTTITVLTGDTVYYGLDYQTSATRNQGSLTAGQFTTVTVPPLWLVSASSSAVQLQNTVPVPPPPSVGVATVNALGTVYLQQPPNAFAVMLGANTSQQTLAINGPSLLPPSTSPNVDAMLFNEPLAGGLAAAAVVQGSPRDCSNTDFLYRYVAWFLGSAAATLVVQSSPDMVTWTQEASVAAAQLGATGVWSASSALFADQAYFRYVLTNGAGAQATSARLVDGAELLLVS